MYKSCKYATDAHCAVLLLILRVLRVANRVAVAAQELRLQCTRFECKPSTIRQFTFAQTSVIRRGCNPLQVNCEVSCRPPAFLDPSPTHIVTVLQYQLLVPPLPNHLLPRPHHAAYSTACISSGSGFNVGRCRAGTKERRRCGHYDGYSFAALQGKEGWIQGYSVSCLMS